MKKLLALSVALATGLPAAAQSNTVPGLNVELGILGGISALGRTGTFPTGLNGLSMSTTSCNNGTVDVNWFQAMDEDHPFIAFLVVRESNGRFQQISDRSWLKHGFFALSSSQCTPCQNPSNGTFLGVGCSDTYGIGTNGSRFDLGPPDEINPWTGSWSAFCSFFDDPNDTGNCDAVRSYNGNEPNGVNHRVEVSDEDLMAPGLFYYGAHYVIAREAEANRSDNIGSKRMTPSWNGNSWSIASSGNVQHGPILDRWFGATVSSALPADDGRVYLGARATDNGDGTWHYEYALYNRDNSRGTTRLRLPVSPGANISNVGTQDIDDDPFNNWLFDQSPGEISWSTNFANNRQPWNTIYNFFFDADVPPASNQGVTIGFYAPGGLGEQVVTSNIAPLDPTAVSYCQGKLNSLGCVPFISSTGGASATATTPFAVSASDVVPNEAGFLLYSVSGRLNLNFHNGKLCVKAPIERLLPPKNSGSSGGPPCSGELSTNFNNRIQSGVDPALLPGQRVNVQWRFRDPALNDGFNDGLSDALEFFIAP